VALKLLNLIILPNELLPTLFQPNCYSKIVDVFGKKHIIIFAMKKICPGQELTYDYKFPIEDVKLTCTCGAKKCRKYMN
jgi:SET domain-containing protein